MREIKELRFDYIDDENLQHIDCWFTGNDNEEGKTVAVVDLDTNKTIYFDNYYRMNGKVQYVIKEIKKNNRTTTDKFISTNLKMFSSIAKYSFKDISEYSELTDEEKKFISEKKFKFLKTLFKN